MVDIKKARKLLGKRGEKMTDNEILKLKEHLTVMADIIIDQVTKQERDKYEI